LERLPQFLKIIVNCRDDDSDIFGCVGRARGYWDRRVDPVADGVDNEAEVAMEPVGLRVSSETC
jgi:hypothetical protein